MNPFHDAHETSLSKLNETDWRFLSNHWSMFSGFAFVSKLGRKWVVSDKLGGVMFKTKTAAERYVSNLILAESRHRSFIRWEQKGFDCQA